MQTRITHPALSARQREDAERILRTCVHCGFCNATCPTHLVLRDERDGPRGRIYLMKQMLEGETAGRATLDHLDRCLVCRSCETTCPSGVAYGRLLEIGREAGERLGVRSWRERALRRLLRLVLPSTTRVRMALRAAPLARPLLPTAITDALPMRGPAGDDARWPAPRHARRMILLAGCVQTATHPAIDAAAARVFDRRDVTLVRASGTGCCGAISHHLSAGDEARRQMIRNIDAWWPLVEAGAEAILSTSSACTSMLQDYARLLGDDPVFGPRAARIARLVRDPGEILLSLPTRAGSGGAKGAVRTAFHAPCSLQHGLRTQEAAATLLARSGYRLTRTTDRHLCCGAAGTYVVLQPTLSRKLQQQKLEALQVDAPEVIATANIGCLIHLQKASGTPVRHWLQLVDDADRGGVTPPPSTTRREYRP